MICPACKLESPPNAQRCDCGYDFVSRRLGPPYGQARVESASVQPSFSWLKGLIHGLVGYLFGATPFLLFGAHERGLRGGAYFFLLALLVSYLFQTGKRIAAWSIVAIVAGLIGTGFVMGIRAASERHSQSPTAAP